MATRFCVGLSCGPLSLLVVCIPLFCHPLKAQERHDPIVVLSGHTHDLVGHLAWSSSSEQLLSSSLDKSVRLWDAGTGKELHQFGVRMGGFVAFLTKRNQAICVESGYSLDAHVWNLTNKRVAKEIAERYNVPFYYASTSILDHPERHFLLGTLRGDVLVYDITSMRLAYELDLPHEREIKSLALSPDGKRLVSTSLCGMACITDLATRRVLVKKDFHHAAHVDVSANDRFIAVAGDAGEIRVFDSNLDGVLFTLPGHRKVAPRKPGDLSAIINEIRFTPDSRCVVTAGHDGTIRVWELASKKEIARFNGHGGKQVYTVEISPDGRFAASGGGDKRICIWRLP